MVGCKRGTAATHQNIDLEVGQPTDEAQHFVVVVADDVRASVAHHRFSVPLALLHRHQNPGLRRRFETRAALLEDRGHELVHLQTQGLVGNRLVEDLVEFAIRTFEASQELVANELWPDLLDRKSVV